MREAMRAREEEAGGLAGAAAGGAGGAGGVANCAGHAVAFNTTWPR